MMGLSLMLTTPPPAPVVASGGGGGGAHGTFRTYATDHWTDATNSDAISANAGDFLIAAFAVNGSTDADPTCSDDASGSYDFIGRGLFNSSASELAVFARKTSVSSTTTITVTGSFSGTVTSSAIVVLAYSGMSVFGSSAITQFKFQENGAASSTPAVTLDSAVNTANNTICIIGSTRNPSSVTEPTGWTAESNDGTETPAIGECSSVRDSGFSGSTVTWGGTSANAFAACVLELNS